MEFDHSLNRIYFLLIAVAALAVAVISILSRPLSPVNETLYTGVAWDMWIHHHFLVPHINGNTYNQKPPLFFWLIELGWKIFGVNSWWPRLLPALCSLASIFISARIATKLFNRNHAIGVLTALILLGMAYWSYYSPRARLDQLLTVCIMLSLYGLARSIRQQSYGVLLFGIGNGLAILTKGPICFIFTLIPYALTPLFFDELKTHKAKWFLGLAGSLLITLAIAALWAIPIMFANPHYAKIILWQQTVSRLTHTHRTQVKVWYYYISRLPLLIMPWLLWPVLWRGLRHIQFRKDATFRWIAYSTLAIFCVLSFLIGQKGSRFLVPLMPLFAIILSYIILQSKCQTSIKFCRLVSLIFITLGFVIFFAEPILLLFKPHMLGLPYFHAAWGLLPITMGIFWWRLGKKNNLFVSAAITISSCVITILLYGIIEHMQNPRNTMQAVGSLIRNIQQHDNPIIFINMEPYDDRFQLAGRITKPIANIHDIKHTIPWAIANQNGYIIQTSHSEWKSRGLFNPIYQQPYRHKHYVQIWQAEDFVLANIQ
jgi:4-amino-4-deoxy-L-arabinose transferase-like glycosyltransferase